MTPHHNCTALEKAIHLKKFKSSEYFREQAKVFYKELPSSTEISMAGEKALVILYNGAPGVLLDCLRYKCFY